MSSPLLDTPTQWTQFSSYLDSPLPLSHTPLFLPQLPNPSPALIDREKSASLDSISNHPQDRSQSFDQFAFSTTVNADLLFSGAEASRTTSSQNNLEYSPPSNTIPYQQAFKSMFSETSLIPCKVCNLQVLPDEYQSHIQFHRNQAALATILPPTSATAGAEALNNAAGAAQKRKNGPLENVSNCSKSLRMSEMSIPSYPDPQFDHLFNSTATMSTADVPARSTVATGTMAGIAAVATTLTNVYCVSDEGKQSKQSTNRFYFKKTKAQTACFLCLGCSGEYARPNYAKTHSKQCAKIKQGLTESPPISYSVVEFPTHQTLQYAKCEWQQLHLPTPKPIAQIVEYVRRMQSGNYSHWNVISGSGAGLPTDNRNLIAQSLPLQFVQVQTHQQRQPQDQNRQMQQHEQQAQQQGSGASLQQQQAQQYPQPDTYAASSTLNKNRWLARTRK